MMSCIIRDHTDLTDQDNEYLVTKKEEVAKETFTLYPARCL